MTTVNDAFMTALETWKTKAIEYAKAEEAYRLAHAKALTESQGKNEAARKADADLATTNERLARDLAEIEKLASFHLMIHLRGSAGETAQ